MKKSMKAVVIDSFGPVENMKIKLVPVPECGKDQMLVRVHAAGVNVVDAGVRSGMLAKFNGELPKILGGDIAGEVEAVGADVKGYKKGDKVMGSVPPWDGGAYAEYAAVNPERFYFMPLNVSFVEAAGVPIAGVTALQSLEKTGPNLNGRDVLVIGASGGVGTFAVQAARVMGAHVTAVCSSENKAMVVSLGAQNVIEYDKTDYLLSGKKFDAIVDYIASGRIDDMEKLLKDDGRYATAVFRQDLPKDGPLSARFISFMCDVNSNSLKWLKENMENGKIKTVVDKIFTLEQAVDAHKYVEAKHTKGKVILKVM
jgi:NADPH:quinone reductase-like Zn-dependent oxidoreductase